GRTAVTGHAAAVVDAERGRASAERSPMWSAGGRLPGRHRGAGGRPPGRRRGVRPVHRPLSPITAPAARSAGRPSFTKNAYEEVTRVRQEGVNIRLVEGAGGLTPRKASRRAGPGKTRSP